MTVLTTDQREATATALAVGITVLAAGLGIFGGLTGTVARMVRNDLAYVSLGVLAILLAVGLAVASRLVSSRARLSEGCLWFGIVLLLIGLGASIGGAMRTISRDDRPTVNAKVTVTETATNVSGSAKVGGLDADQPLFVQVFDGDRQLYYAIAGANQDGLVEHEFSVVIDTATDDVLVIASRDATINRCPTAKDTAKKWKQTGCATLAGP